MRVAAVVAVVAAACSDHRAPSSSSSPSSASPPQQPSSSASAPSSPPPVGRTTVTVGGHHFAAELRPESGRFMQSEPIYVDFVITGADDPDLVVTEVVCDFVHERPATLAIRLVGPDGAVPVPEVSEPDAHTRDVRLGDGDIVEHLFLPDWYAAITPGAYTIELTADLGVYPSPNAKRDEVHVAVTVPIEVVPDDAAGPGAVIDRAAAAVVGADQDVALREIRRLARIHDPRVIDPLVAASRRNDYDRRLDVVRALAGWNDDRAVAGLVAVGKTTAGDMADQFATRGDDLPASNFSAAERHDHAAGMLRSYAAEALAVNPTPSALDALIAMKDDPFDAVRIAIFKAACRMPEVTGIPLIRHYTKDPSGLIRHQAELFLERHGAGAK